MSAVLHRPRNLPRVGRCGCGYVLWSEDLEELLEAANEHVRRAHPELVGTLSPLELARPRDGREQEIAA